jgi:transcriptional regulator with XRE-family HTH domain
MVTRIGSKGGNPARLYFRQWREKRGLTQEQVAERLNTTKATVSRMETGKVQYNRGYLEALALALSIEPDQLLRDPEQPSADSLLQKASPEQRARVLSVIDALLKAG